MEDHPLFDIPAKLQKGFSATMVQMRTGETASHLTVRSSLEDLSLPAEVFPRLKQIPGDDGGNVSRVRPDVASRRETNTLGGEKSYLIIPNGFREGEF